MKHYDRAWAQIDLDLLDENLEAMHEHLKPGVSLIGVVKADGYGHGAVAIARKMQEKEYVSGFAVATLEEAQILKKSGIQKPLLVLGYTFPAGYEEMIADEIRGAAFTEEMLSDMSAEALRLGKEMLVHIAVDTGMSRIGIQPDDSGLAFVKRAIETPGICVEGIFTHFATADEADKQKTYDQLQRFTSFLDRIREELHFTIPVCHAANSAGIIEIKEAQLDAVRAGIILYGLWPSEEVPRDILPLKPIMSLHSRVAFIKELEAGREISYGGTYTTEKKMRVATIPLGYGDGYPRGLSNKGDVLICGRRARILGRVCMDQFMVDVTDIPEAKTGSLVTLIGKDGAEEITAEEMGDLSGRFNYELVCCLTRRIPRVYYKAGKMIYSRDYFEDYE